jgi:hypothetical protein
MVYPIGRKFVTKAGVLNMSDFEIISRRKAFSLLGLAAALGFAVPTTVLTVSDADAQTVGMERRQERRTGRHERREERRTGRHERREERRTGRHERREERRL